MEQAPIEERIIKQCAKEGSPLPKRIADSPQIQLGLDLYYDAFWELTTCRPLGWGIGPIPWSSMRDYAQTFDFDEEQTSALFYYIRVMDNAYMGKKWQKAEGSKHSPAGWGSSQK